MMFIIEMYHTSSIILLNISNSIQNFELSAVNIINIRDTSQVEEILRF